VETADALRLLRIGATEERRAAARLLEDEATVRDVPRLNLARDRELDNSVRSAIEDAVSAASARTDPDAEPKASLTTPGSDYARGVSDATRLVVHEIRALVGRARLEVAREVDEPDQSPTASTLRRLQRLLRAVDKLGSVATSTGAGEFDLATLIATVSTEQGQEFGVEIVVDGPSSLRVRSDADLVDVVLRNAIVNACESTAALSPEDRWPINIEFATTDRESWIEVTDRGTGLASNLRPFEFAASNKEGHLGVGLAVAVRAAATLGGSVSLHDRTVGKGACFHFSWPALEVRDAHPAR
jgi:signal transduction histidine kinase